jgi:hypothetical protein
MDNQILDSGDLQASKTQNQQSFDSKGLLSCPKAATSKLQKDMYNYLFKMYPTPVTPEEILENCENTKIENVWYELDKGPLKKIVRFKGKVKYTINKRRIK